MSINEQCALSSHLNVSIDEIRQMPDDYDDEYRVRFNGEWITAEVVTKDVAHDNMSNYDGYPDGYDNDDTYIGIYKIIQGTEYAFRWM